MLAAGDQACYMAMMGLGFGLEQVPHTMVQRTPLSHPLTSRACGGKLYLWVRLKKHCRSPRPLIPSARLAMWSERTTGSTSTSGRRAKGCRELPDIGVWSSSHLIRMSNTPATRVMGGAISMRSHGAMAMGLPSRPVYADPYLFSALSHHKPLAISQTERRRESKEREKPMTSSHSHGNESA